MYPSCGSFYVSGFFIDPQFCPFIFWAAFGTPVKLLSLHGSGIRVPLPTKVEPTVETFLLAPSLITLIDAYHFSTLVGMSL